MKKGDIVEVQTDDGWIKAEVEFRITNGEPLGEYSFYRVGGGGRFTACGCKVRPVGSAKKYCCASLKDCVEQSSCRHHPSKHDCPDFIILPRFDFEQGGAGFVLPIKDGGRSFRPIYYCPFCGYDLKDLKP